MGGREDGEGRRADGVSGPAVWAGGGRGRAVGWARGRAPWPATGLDGEGWRLQECPRNFSQAGCPKYDLARIGGQFF